MNPLRLQPKTIKILIGAGILFMLIAFLDLKMNHCNEFSCMSYLGKAFALMAAAIPTAGGVVVLITWGKWIFKPKSK